jgi:hypothetical protein
MELTMTDGLNGKQVQWLTYLIYLLMTLVTAVTAWNSVKLSDIPEKYVQTERYTHDQNRLESYLSRIDAKLDRVIERK